MAGTAGTLGAVKVKVELVCRMRVASGKKMGIRLSYLLLLVREAMSADIVHGHVTCSSEPGCSTSGCKPAHPSDCSMKVYTHDGDASGAQRRRP